MLNKSYLLKPKEFWKYDWQLVVAVFLLCIGGFAFLASSLNVQPDNYWQELAKQLVIGLGVGGLITLVLARTDYHYLTQNRKQIAIITLSLLGFVALFATMVWFVKGPMDKINFIGRFSWLPIKPHIANGAVRWIDLPFGLPNIQPSEIAKIATLIVFAGSLAKKNMVYSWLTLKRPLWFLAIVSGLILIQPDLGTTLMIFMIVMSAMWVARVPWYILSKIFIFCIVASALLVFSTPYRLQRFTSIYAGLLSNSSQPVNNEEDRQQVANIQYAMQNGGLLGKGYGNSEWKQAGKIYEASTDSIIAVIGEEVGFAGTLAFLSLYVWIFARAMTIANNSPDLEGKMLATGIGVWIFAQVFLNTSGMTGLIPMKGLPLPFVSQGGTALVMNLIGVGILLNISSQSNLSKKNY